MRNRLGKFILTALIMSVMLSCFGLTAYAQDYFTVTVKSGDSACSLCKENGLDYKASKNLIMALNKMKKESDLGELNAGDTLKLPTAQAVKNSAISGDTVKFYVIPYVIQKGDSIAKVYRTWALNYANYEEYIKSLNEREDLDLIYVGDTYLLPTTSGNCQTATYTVVMSHTMKSGESAEDICAAYNVSYKDNKAKLERYNLGQDITKLKAGAELLIPLI